MRERPTEGIDMAKRLVEKLWEDLQASPKSLSEITKAAGVNPNYPRLQNSKGTMDLLRFCCLVHSYGQDLPTFVSQALDSIPEEDLIERHDGKEPAIVSAARQRALESSPGTILRSHIERMDDLRYDDPEKALHGIESTIDFVDPNDVPLALGVYASCCRPLTRIRDAWSAISTALDLVQPNHQPTIRANLLQRAASLHRERCHYGKALAISERATVEYARLGDLRGMAQTLVDQGSMLTRLGRFDEGESSFRSGIKLLPSEDRRHLCAGYQALAVLLQYRGRNREALEALTTTVPLAASRVEKGKVRWLEGRCLIGLGRETDALQSFEVALDLLMNTAPSDAALLICDKAHLLLSLGRPEEAYSCAKAMRALFMTLEEKSPRIAALVIELAAVEDKSSEKLSISFIANVRERIEKASQR